MAGEQGWNFLLRISLLQIVEVLNHAIQDIVTQDPDSGEIYHEDVPSYPFQIVRGLREEEAAA